MTTITKKSAIILMLVYILALAGCGGGSSGAGGGGDGAPSGGGAAAASAESKNADPCECCPDCIQKDCACEKCADSKDCKCYPPGGDNPAKTYDVEIRTEWKDIDSGCPYPGECGGVTSGKTTVTANFIDNSKGYYGTSEDGAGEYISYNSHYWDSAGREMLGHSAPGTGFGFSASLSIPGAGNTIKAGFNFTGEGDVTMNWPNGETLPFPGMMGQIQGWFSGTYTINGIDFDTSGILDSSTYEYDRDTGMFVLELPLTDSEMQKTFSWDNMGFTITITLTPAD